MLQNAYFLAKIGADTAENEQHFAEILPTDAASAAVAAGDRRRHGQVQAPLPRAPARGLLRARGGQEGRKGQEGSPPAE